PLTGESVAKFVEVHAHQAFRAACAVEEIVYDAVQRVAASGTRPADAVADARQHLLALDVSDLGVSYGIFAQGVAALRVPSNEVKSPLAESGALTGALLGKGRWWFRDLLRSAPLYWRPSRRAPFSRTLGAPRQNASRRDLF